MMKSGLSQNEKLEALRHVIENIDQKTLSNVLSKKDHIDSQINFFKQSGVDPPFTEQWRIDRDSRRCYTDDLLPMRFAACYSGNSKSIRDAKHNLQDSVHFLKRCQDSVLCLTDYDINTEKGHFHHLDERHSFWVYQGREQNGDYSFKYNACYWDCDKCGDRGEHGNIKRMCPAEAMKLRRREFFCTNCWDYQEYFGTDEDGAPWCNCYFKCEHCKGHYYDCKCQQGFSRKYDR
jgi:hypothetical protein